MRSTILVAMMLAVLPCSAARAGEAAERQWTIGYAEAEITPDVGQVQMSGFGRERYAKGALAPLLTQTVVLRDRDGRTGVLITADIAGFGRVMTEAIRRSIARKHGIPPENVILAASHTHWGPATRFHATFACGAPNVWYMGFLEDKILGNVDAALENLSPASVEYGSIDFHGIGCNRRLPKDGKITFYLGRQAVPGAARSQRELPLRRTDMETGQPIDDLRHGRRGLQPVGTDAAIDGHHRAGHGHRLREQRGRVHSRQANRA